MLSNSTGSTFVEIKKIVYCKYESLIYSFKYSLLSVEIHVSSLFNEDYGCLRLD